MVNSWTLEKQLVVGLPIPADNPCAAIVYLSDKEWRKIRFDQTRGAPLCRDGRMIEASPTTILGEKCFTGKGNWNGAILMVKAAQLDLRGFRHLQFNQITNFWVGAEIEGQIFAQIGCHSGSNKVQILALEPDDYAYIVDCQKRCAKVSCRKGALVFSAPTVDEFARSIANRALSAKNHRAMMWAWHTLEVLGSTNLWSAKHRDKLAKFSGRCR